MAWVGPAVTGWQEPVLLVAARSPGTVRQFRRVVARFGLRHEAVVYAHGAVVHADGTGTGDGDGDGDGVGDGAGAGSAVLVFGPERIGPVPVSGQWVELAREHGEVVLLVGVAPVPEGMEVDAYLERHSDEVLTGLVPVAGAANRRCLATVAVPESGSEPVPGRSVPTGCDGQREVC